jgi:hypothetical protein
MGKSEDQIKKKVKEVKKSPISMFWLGTFLSHLPRRLGPSRPARCSRSARRCRSRASCYTLLAPPPRHAPQHHIAMCLFTANTHTSSDPRLRRLRRSPLRGPHALLRLRAYDELEGPRPCDGLCSLDLDAVLRHPSIVGGPHAARAGDIADGYVPCSAGKSCGMHRVGGAPALCSASRLNHNLREMGFGANGFIYKALHQSNGIINFFFA